MDTLSDEQLVARVMAGERAALAPLVERYHGPLLSYLFRLTDGDRPLAEDLVQDTFLRVLQQRTYQPGRPFKPWLYAVATHLAHDHFRSPATRRTTRLDDDQETPMHGIHDASPGPEERAQMAEQGRAVAWAVQQLGGELRVTLLLRFDAGLSLREIAEALGVPLGTVKSRLSAGTHKLRSLLVSVNQGEER